MGDYVEYSGSITILKSDEEAAAKAVASVDEDYVGSTLEDILLDRFGFHRIEGHFANEYEQWDEAKVHNGDMEILETIAPFINEDACLDCLMHVDGGIYWRWKFKDGQLHEYPGRIVYADEHPEIWLDEETMPQFKEVPVAAE